jgi:hypothetical protein
MKRAIAHRGMTAPSAGDIEHKQICREEMEYAEFP